MSTQVPGGDGVFTLTEAGPRLLGSKCTDCGTYAFPPQKSCQRCSGINTEATNLGTRGTLWTFTIQGFPPKSPPFIGDADLATFKPFGVGYVEIPGQVKVETRLTESDPSKLKIGMEMELVVDVLKTDADGNDIVTYAFKPVG